MPTQRYQSDGILPPGFLALDYGRGTPVVTVVAHIVYGGIIGGLYHLKP